MNKRKPGLLIVLASITIMLLLTMQVTWIVKSAKVKEEQFNHSVNMALCKVAEVMCDDPESCASLESCCMNQEEETCALVLDESQKNRIDSLIRYYMDFYHIKLDYSFEIMKAEKHHMKMMHNKNTYNQTFDPGLPGNYQLRVVLPDKHQFIRAEMTGVFITSIILILILIGLFYQTVRSLMRNNLVLRRTTDFVNNMTHEFRTPLANISLAVNKLSKNDLPPEKHQRYTGIIQEENERLKEQVERLLELNEMKQGLQLKTGLVSIHELITDLIKCNMPRVEEKRGSINFLPEASEHVLSADMVHLKNAISNLLDNAIKYSGGKPEITIRTFNKDHYIITEVSDKGIGISENDQKHIFERFYRVNEGDVHNVKGFGIGLTYVEKVIESHKGSIALKSQKGIGTTFVITLPL